MTDELRVVGDLRSRLAGQWLSDDGIAAKRRSCEQLVSPLSTTETVVLTKLAQGSSNREIALALGMSLADLDALRSTIFAKIGAHSTSDAVRVAIYAGLD